MEEMDKKVVQCGQKISEKVKELRQNLDKQTIYINATTRAIKSLRQELKRATLMAAKLEGAIEAYSSSESELLMEVKDGG